MLSDKVLKAAKEAQDKLATVTKGKDNAERVNIKAKYWREGDTLHMEVPHYFATVQELPMRPQDKTPTFGANLTETFFQDPELGKITRVSGKRGFEGFKLS